MNHHQNEDSVITNKNFRDNIFGGKVINNQDTESEPQTKVLNSPMMSKKDLSNNHLNQDMEVIGLGKKNSTLKKEKPVQDMCTQIDFSDDDLVIDKNSIHNMGDSGGTTDIIDNSYRHKKSQGETKARFQLPKGERQQHRRTNAHWRTQSATETNS